MSCGASSDVYDGFELDAFCGCCVSFAFVCLINDCLWQVLAVVTGEGRGPDAAAKGMCFWLFGFVVVAAVLASYLLMGFCSLCLYFV